MSSPPCSPGTSLPGKTRQHPPRPPWIPPPSGFPKAFAAPMPPSASRWSGISERLRTGSASENAAKTEPPVSNCFALDASRDSGFSAPESPIFATPDPCVSTARMKKQGETCKSHQFPGTRTGFQSGFAEAWGRPRPYSEALKNTKLYGCTPSGSGDPGKENRAGGTKLISEWLRKTTKQIFAFQTSMAYNGEKNFSGR